MALDQEAKIILVPIEIILINGVVHGYTTPVLDDLRRENKRECDCVTTNDEQLTWCAKHNGWEHARGIEKHLAQTQVKINDLISRVKKAQDEANYVGQDHPEDMGH